MSNQAICICGEPVLRKKARAVKDITDEYLALLDRMGQVMLSAHGAGLAAPQVGEQLQALVIRSDLSYEDEEEEEAEETPDSTAPELLALFNPRLVTVEGEDQRTEGCLSLPTLYGKVDRPEYVKVNALTPQGEEVDLEFEGFLARALCHEIDHLLGTLFIDRVDPETLVWMVPDSDEEAGYRYDSTTLDQALEAFERLRRRRAAE